MLFFAPTPPVPPDFLRKTGVDFRQHAIFCAQKNQFLPSPEYLKKYQK